MADNRALHAARTKVFFAVGIKEHSKIDGANFAVYFEVPKAEGLFSRHPSLLKYSKLFEFDFCASLFQLFLGGFSISLGNALFNGFRSAVNQVFGFFKTQTCDFTNSFNH